MVSAGGAFPLGHPPLWILAVKLSYINYSRSAREYYARFVPGACRDKASEVGIRDLQRGQSRAVWIFLKAG